MKLEDHVARYADDLTHVCAMAPDMSLLAGVTQACGPLIYDPATEVLSPADLPAFRKNFLLRRLGLPPGPALDEALAAALDAYPSPRPYRAVLAYILVLHFGRADLFRPKAG